MDVHNSFHYSLYSIVVKGSDIPDLIEILVGYAHKWTFIAEALKFTEVQIIECNHPKSVQQCFSALLNQWSQWPTKLHRESPTVERLCDALRSSWVKLDDVAREIYSIRKSLPSQCERKCKSSIHSV